MQPPDQVNVTRRVKEQQMSHSFPSQWSQVGYSVHSL